MKDSNHIQINTKEELKKPSKREINAFKNKCLIDIASDLPVSNKLINPINNDIDANALNYIMEIGMLVKILQEGLISEDMFIDIKNEVSKRYKIYSSLPL